jgi:hypothetical protein
MENLIYRGVTHDGSSTSQRRLARDMSYRGVRHDGLPAALRLNRGTFVMVYRGVRYMESALRRDGRPVSVRTVQGAQDRAGLLAA